MANREMDARKLGEPEIAVGVQITVGKTLDMNILHQMVSGILLQHDHIATGKGGIDILIRQRDEDDIEAECQLKECGEEVEPYVPNAAQRGSESFASDG